jgi:hypothetical protein
VKILCFRRLFKKTGGPAGGRHHGERPLSQSYHLSLPQPRGRLGPGPRPKRLLPALAPNASGPPSPRTPPARHRPERLRPALAPKGAVPGPLCYNRPQDVKNPLKGRPRYRRQGPLFRERPAAIPFAATPLATPPPRRGAAARRRCPCASRPTVIFSSGF